MSCDVLTEALRVVTGPRRQAYGDPAGFCDRLADVWTALFADLLAPGARFQARHVALAMIALKLVREAHRHSRDNVVDIAGYAWVLGQCTEASGEHGPGR